MTTEPRKKFSLIGLGRVLALCVNMSNSRVDVSNVLSSQEQTVLFEADGECKVSSSGLAVCGSLSDTVSQNLSQN